MKKSKEALIEELVKSLNAEKEITKIVVFGSFINSDNPNDLDVAIFQDSHDDYLTLAMKYRKLARKISKEIPLDIIPVKPGAKDSFFLDEIEAGEVIYER